MLIVSFLIVPAIMTVCGLYLTVKPPKNRNRWFGYRTRASMRDQESWDFAQRYCGKLWLAAGVLMLLVSIVLLKIVPKLREDPILLTVGMLVQTLLLVLSILPIEKALRKR